MPNYSKSDIKFIVDKADFNAMFNGANKKRDRVWLLCLWLTGARPTELLLTKKKDINIEEDNTTFRLKTKKLGFKRNEFIIEYRTLVLNIKKDHRYIRVLDSYLKKFKRPDMRVFNFSRRTGLNIIYNVSEDILGKTLCQYNFRHSRMTLLAESGATKDELKRFKGSRTDRSVSKYIHARHVKYRIDMDIDT